MCVFILYTTLPETLRDLLPTRDVHSKPMEELPEVTSPNSPLGVLLLETQGETAGLCWGDAPTALGIVMPEVIARREPNEC